MGSMIGFLTSRAFLTLAFFDLFWAIFGAAVCLKSVVMSGSWLPEESQVEEDMEMEPVEELEAMDTLS